MLPWIPDAGRMIVDPLEMPNESITSSVEGKADVTAPLPNPETKKRNRIRFSCLMCREKK
jgi:hypothetical protein